MNRQIASELLCPITYTLFTDPISVPCCTKFFERSALIESLQNCNFCPLCRSDISDFDAFNAPKNLTIMSLVETMKNSPIDLPKHRWNVELNVISETKNMIGELCINISDAKFNINTSKCILVCDFSGSMMGNPIEQVKTALIHIMSMCSGSNVKPIIVAFGSLAKIVEIDMSNTIEEISKIINSIECMGGTLFKSAFDKINQILEQNQQNQDVNVIFLTDGQDSTVGLINYFNDMLSKYESKFTTTVHSVGFGDYCDKVLLEGLRSPLNGIFQYAEPTDSGDTLCNKITSLFEIACNLSKVPITISFPTEFNLNTKELQLPIQYHKSGEYKMFIDLPEKFDKIKLIINSEYDNNTEIDIKINSKKNSKLFRKYISYVIDEISNEIVKIFKETTSENIKTLKISLIEQKLDTLSTIASENDIQRIKFLKSQLDGENVNMGKLLDSRFSSKFGFTKNENINSPKALPSTVIQKNIDIVSFNEPNVKYRNVETHNEFQKSVMNHHFNSITKEQQELLDKLTFDDITYIDENGNNSLHLICYKGNLTLLKNVIDKFEKEILNIINDTNNDNESAVTLAIKARGYNKTLETLFKYGGIIPEDRKSKLEAYCINNDYNITAEIISNYLGSSSNDSSVIEFKVHEKQTDGYLKYTYDKLIEKLNSKEKVIYDPLNFLEVALKKCNVDIVKDILERHQEPKLKIPGEFLLEHCLPKKPDAEDTPIYIELTKLLIRYNLFIILEENINGENCLFKAAEKGSLPHVQLFIQKFNDNGGCMESFELHENIDVSNNIGNTPLWVACSKRYPCIIEELLKNDADPNHINKKGNSCLYGICRTGPVKIAEMLLAYGADPENVNSGEDTLILICCRHGQVDILKLLLNYTTEEFVNRIPSFDGFNALFASVENDNSECIIALHEFGISLNQKTLSDNKILASASPLHLAAFYNRTKAAKTLLDLNCNPNELDVEGRTPLIIAVIQGNVEIILLLRNCTDMSIIDKSQNTALSYSRSKQEISKILINPAAKVLSDISKGLFTKEEEKLAYRILSSNTIGINGILSKSDCINIYDSNNITPLMYSVIYSNYIVTKLFLELGADPLLKNSFGLDTTIYAKWINNKRISELKQLDSNNETSYNRLKKASKENSTNRMLLYINPVTKYQETTISFETTINYRFEYCVKYCIKSSNLVDILYNEIGNEKIKYIIKIKAIELEKEFGVVNEIDEDKDKFLWELIKNIPFDIKFNVVSHIAMGEDILSVQDLIVLYVYTSYNTIEYTRYLADFDFTLLLMNAMRKIYPFTNEVFMGSNDINRSLFKIGETVTFPCFLSTTSMWRIALNNTPEFTTTKKGTILIIKSKTGKFVGQYSRDNFNGEVLFNPFTKFKVTNWYIGGDVIALGQENVRAYSYTIKDEDKPRYLTTNKSLIIELMEC